jgi:hypothetical protein
MYGTVPSTYGTVPSIYGTVPSMYGTVPSMYGTVPINGCYFYTQRVIQEEMSMFMAVIISVITRKKFI